MSLVKWFAARLRYVSYAREPPSNVGRNVSTEHVPLNLQHTHRGKVVHGAWELAGEVVDGEVEFVEASAMSPRPGGMVPSSRLKLNARQGKETQRRHVAHGCPGSPE